MHQGGIPCHEFPAVANVVPTRFGISVDRKAPDADTESLITASVRNSIGAWFGRPLSGVDDMLHNMYGYRNPVAVGDIDIVVDLRNGYIL
eukprot:1808194-Karenia_brevis.AAC.1